MSPATAPGTNAPFCHTTVPDSRTTAPARPATTTEIEAATGARIAFITRYGDALLPQSYTVLQDGDLVHALYAPGDRDKVERVFESGPEAS